MSDKHNRSLGKRVRETFEYLVVKAQLTLGPLEISGEY
jgi:hypothetical protein